MKCLSLLIYLFCVSISISQEIVRIDSLGRVLEIVYKDSSYIRFENKDGYHWRRVYDKRGRLKQVLVEKGVLLFRYEFVEPKKVGIVDGDSDPDECVDD